MVQKKITELSLRMHLLLLPGFFLRHLQRSSLLRETFRFKNETKREAGIWRRGGRVFVK